MKKLIVSAFALAAFALSANAQIKTAPLKADATLISQIAISTTKGSNTVDLGTNVAGGELQFGNIGLSGVASTVLVSADGTRTAGVGSPGVSNTSVTPTAAGFWVSGGAGLTYSISIPSTLALTGGGGNCSVSNFVLTGTNLTRTIAVGGYDGFAVGGTLNIDAAATAGAVTGQLNVSIAYN